jgi:succinate dehydrogenase / fumarate reductase membrane anchor subunit
LTLWFVAALLGMEGYTHTAVVAWMAQPLNSILLILLVVVMLHHSQLGLQVVVEDYVHAGGWKVLILMLSRFAHVAAAVAAVYSIVVLSVRIAN